MQVRSQRLLRCWQAASSPAAALRAAVSAALPAVHALPAAPGCAAAPAAPPIHRPRLFLRRAPPPAWQAAVGGRSAQPPFPPPQLRLLAAQAGG